MSGISCKAKEILNDGRLIEKRNRWFQRLQGVFDGGEGQVLYVNGSPAVPGAFEGPNPYQEPEKWVVAALEWLAIRAEGDLTDECQFRPPALEFGPYGVHFIDSIFDAEVFFQHGQWYNRTLQQPIGGLDEPDWKESHAFGLARRALNAFLECGVALPVFGLPTIASALNIGVNLFGQRILIEMVIEHENAYHDLSVINGVLIEMHRWFCQHIPETQLQPVVSWNRTQPPGYGQICGCTTQLLSPELYSDYIAPLDAALLSVYPHGGMIHLCGSHKQHIPAFREMKELKAVQINDAATRDMDAYFNGLRKDQVLYLNPCEGMTVADALVITGGRRIVIAANHQE